MAKKKPSPEKPTSRDDEAVVAVGRKTMTADEAKSLGLDPAPYGKVK